MANSFFDLPPEGGITASDPVDPAQANPVGAFDASQGYATPEARQYKTAQKVERVKAKDFFGRTNTPTVDNGVTVAPVTDESGAPLANYDSKSRVGWDVWGNPARVDQNPNGGVELRDPYADAPRKVDKRDGTIYMAPEGLPWRPTGQQDPETVQRNQEKATAAAASAVGQQARMEAGDVRAVKKDIKATTEELEGIVPGISTAPDINTARKALDDTFNEQYADPAANRTVGFFGNELTPEAQQMRAQIDQRKADAHARLTALDEKRRQVAIDEQRATGTKATARQLQEQVIQRKLAEARAAGVEIPETNPVDPEAAQAAAQAQPQAITPQVPTTPEQENAAALMLAQPLPDEQLKQIVAQPEQRMGYLQEIGRGIARGSLSMTKSLGGFMRLLGAESAGKFVTEAGEYYDPDFEASKDVGEFSPTNPRWWAARLPEVVPQLGAQLGLAFLTGGASVPVQLAAFAAPTLATTAGDVYNEAVADRLKKGESATEARDGAIGEATLVGTISAGLDMIPGAEFLTKNPAVRTLMGRAIRNGVLRRGAAGFLAEGVTEAGQEVVQDLGALGFRQDAERFNDAWQRYASSFLLGGVLGGAVDVAIGHPDAPEVTPPATGSTPPVQPAPQSPDQGEAAPVNPVASPEPAAPVAPEQPISSPSVVEPGETGQPNVATETPVAPAEGDFEVLQPVPNADFVDTPQGRRRITVSTQEGAGGSFQIGRVKLHNDDTGAYEQFNISSDKGGSFPTHDDARRAGFEEAKRFFGAKLTAQSDPGAELAQAEQELEAADERDPMYPLYEEAVTKAREKMLAAAKPIESSIQPANPNEPNTQEAAVSPEQSVRSDMPEQRSVPVLQEQSPASTPPADTTGGQRVEQISNAETPSEPTTPTTPSSAATPPTVTPTQPAQPAALSAPLSRDWGDIVPSDDIGATIVTLDGRTGKVTAVTKGAVQFRMADGKKQAVSKGRARVTDGKEAGGANAATEQPAPQSKALEPKPAKPKRETPAERKAREKAEFDADYLPAAATTTHEGQKARTLAQAALRLHSDELRTLGHSVDIQIGETTNDSGIYTTAQGKIIIDPEKVALDTAKLTPAEQLKKIKRAIAEEVFHVATLKYASENSENYSRVKALAADGEWSQRAGEAYGPEWAGLNDFQKGAEIARMIAQGRGGKLTEASYRYLVDFMKWLRRKVKNLSQDTRQVVSDIEAQMGRFRKESNAAKVSEKVTGPTRQFSNGAIVGPGLHGLGAAAYHGTPHKVDKFSTEKIGTGEGAQVYGYGLYFAENPSVAEAYRENLTKSNFSDATRDTAKDYIRQAGGDRSRAMELLKDFWSESGGNPSDRDFQETLRAIDDKPGNTYTVDINAADDELLDWDKPLGEQSEKVKTALEGAYGMLLADDSTPGANIYGNIVTNDRVSPPYETTAVRGRKASEYLAARGIVGIKYLDQGSRDAKDGTRNYVVFDDSRITITHENGKPVTPKEREDMGLAAASSESNREPQKGRPAIAGGPDSGIVDPASRIAVRPSTEPQVLTRGNTDANNAASAVGIDSGSKATSDSAGGQQNLFAASAGRGRTLYRSAEIGDTTAGAHFSENKSDAKAYQDNPGFGGPNLFEFRVDNSRVAEAATLKDLANLLEPMLNEDQRAWADEHDGLFRAMKDIGYYHTFHALENSFGPRGDRIDAVKLLAKDHDWIRFTDDFPEGAKTWKYIGSEALIPNKDEPSFLAAASSREPVTAERAQEIADEFDAEDPGTWPKDLRVENEVDIDDSDTWKPLLSKDDQAKLAKLEAEGETFHDGDAFEFPDAEALYQTAQVEYDRRKAEATTRAGDLAKQLEEPRFLFAAASEKPDPGLMAKIREKFESGKLTQQERDEIGPVLGRSIKDVYEGTADVFKRQEGTAPLGIASEKAVDREREFRGHAQVPFRALRKEMGAKAFDAAALEVKAYREQADRKTADAPILLGTMSENGKAIVAAQDEILSRYGSMAEKLGVQVQDDNGKWRPFQKRKDYFPRMIDRKLLNAIQNPSQNPREWRKAVKIFVEWSKGERGAGGDARTEDGIQYQGAIPILDSASDVLKYTSKPFREGRGNDHNGNIEHSRSLPMPNKIYDHSFAAFGKYVANASRRLAQIEAFGQKATPDSKDLWEKTIDKTSDVPTREYIARVRDVTYGVRPRDAATKYMAILNNIATGTQLTNPVTSMANLLGGISDNIHMFGVANTLKGVMGMRRAGEVINDAYAKGLLHDDLMQMAHDSEEYGSNAVEATGALAGKALKLAGYNMVEEFNRGLSLAAGRSFVRQGIEATKANPNSRAAREFASFVSKTGADPAQVISENGEGRESDKFLRRAANESQGGYTPSQLPLFVSTPIGKFILKYNSWGTQHTRFFMRRAVEPAMEFIKTNGKSGSITPLLRYGLVTALTGLGLTALKEALFGQADTTASIAEIQKTATQDEKRAFVLSAQKLWKAQMAVSAGGIIGNYAQMGMDIAERSRAKNPLAPPGTAAIVNSGEMVFRLLEQKKLTLTDLNDFLRGQISAYRTVQSGAAKAAEKTGAPVLATERARQDLSWLGAQTRRFASEVGVEASRTSMGRIGTTELTPAKRAVLDALRTGDVNAARKAVKDYTAAVDPKKRADAMKSLAASVRASQPVKVGAAGEARREIFLTWAAKRLPADAMQRINTIDRRYRETARKVGLFDPAPVTPKAMAAAKAKLAPPAPAKSWWAN